jgi:hypothetical protein
MGLDTEPRPMTTEEELLAAAEALGESVLVVGAGDRGAAAAEAVVAADVPATAEAASPDAVVLAVDGATDPGTLSVLADAPLRVAVVAVPPRPDPTERELLAALGERVDAVVLAAAADAAALTDAVGTFVSVVRDPGFVNLDLADARTVLRPVEFAALGVGADDRGAAEGAVAEAFASLPAGVETDPADGVLVDLLGGPEMSVEDVSDAVTAVRGRVGPDAHVIWGGGVDETLGEAVRVRLVVASVSNVRAAPGDPCPRCAAALSAYTLGGRTSLSCGNCGFAGVSVRLGESATHD